MVSFQEFDLINSDKKRRWDDRSFEGEESLEKEWKFAKVLKTKSLFDDIKFHHDLERSSTLDDSKKCLDIQVKQGEVLYNTKNQKISSTNKDPKQSPKKLLEMGPMSLDLELNLLPYDSPRTQEVDENCSSTKHGSAGNNMTTSVKSSKCTPFSKDTDRQLIKNSDVLRRCPSWMSLEADQQEMVAAACMQCHMLVMLCKSSPACPNCKFMHPPGHQGPINNLFKPRFSTTTLSWKN